MIKFTAGVPNPPAWLDKLARHEYRRCATELIDAGANLQMVDASVLCGYAQAAADCARLTCEIREAGEIVTLPNGIQTAHPLIAVRNAAQKYMIVCAAKLGFSPADRGRVPFSPKTKRDHDYPDFASV